MLESSGSSVTGSSVRKRNLVKRQKKNEGVDMINMLPEPLISRILSFLPTKDAVRTCVSSKKWLFRWTFITKLDLDDTVFYSPKRKNGGKMFFMNFVYRALLLTQSKILESVSLTVVNKYDVSLLNTWVSNILIRDVRSLRIDTSFEMPLTSFASHSLFNSKFLEELVLNMKSCAIRVYDSDFVHFGLLRILKLSGILFTVDPSYRTMNLSLPVLKVFETTNCTWLNAKCVTLNVPLLESVIIVQNAKSMSYDTPKCSMCFFASNLIEFSYCGDGYISHYFKLQLELGLVSGEVLLGLLLKSPVLKTLLFKGISKFAKELLNSTAVPDCLTYTLQVVKFRKVHGCEHELWLAKFFVENGLVLERMSFSLVSQWLGKSKIMEDFKEKLFSFKRGFSFAFIEFSYDD
uniref:F-box/LRR-repeat protein At3g59200 family n=1 Tax=Cajanus cajan TaxID=3821 RepID=A0A151R940_CAJCA|nr:F-box/LRR-repeat protein At3g59200 family [Cajanus cajan]